MFEYRRNDGVLRASAPTALRWLSTGWNGGFATAADAYNITVPSGWSRTDLDGYVRERLEAAGFAGDGPALLTGVDQQHAVGARLEPVTVVATVGLSNPAGLPMDPDGSDPDGLVDADPGGTVNVIAATDRALGDGGLATLLSVVVEAKAATLQQTTGFTGTTSDAVIVGSNPQGRPTEFAGSATPVGDAARAAVRDAVLAGIRARYADDSFPATVAEADSGIETTRRAAVFDP